MIIVLDGPINAGKSTVGARLAGRLAHTVHIEVDHLRHFAGGLTLAQAIPYALADAASLAEAWTGRGFHVIVNWPIEPANLRYFAAVAAQSGAPLFVFTLLPRRAVALGDRGERRLIGSERARIKEMYAGMYAAGRGAGIVIDNSDQTADETVQIILDHIQNADQAAESALVKGPVPVFSLTDQPALADAAAIRQRIKEFNDSVSEDHRQARPVGKQPLAAFMRDAAGQLIGGLLASTYWGWLDIDELWIAEGWRGQGHGRTLMVMVEKAAMGRGCRMAQVKTWDFQARGFYERLGYRVIGRLADYPPGRTFYWLRKEFRHPAVQAGH
jgi:ribosomal protein S18 acetylase RimI-like enzyme